MGIEYLSECFKCHRSSRFDSEDAILESKQVGCIYCSQKKEGYPKYYPDYDALINKWIIIKKYWKPKLSWFGFGLVKDYLVEENYRYEDNEFLRVAQFNTLKECREYINIRLLKEKNESNNI